MWNAMVRKKPKIIQVPMNEELLERLDAYSTERGQSRAAFIREACAEYVAKITDDELDRQYVESYRNFPEATEDDEWRAKLAAEIWGEESFEDWLDAEG
jgi:metal-responsive CopG/Arc/MetJ family transcriptional regulator